MVSLVTATLAWQLGTTASVVRASSDPVNIAFQKLTTAYSTFNCCNNFYLPSYAVDGVRYDDQNLHSWAWTPTDPVDNGSPWWQVDFQDRAQMDSVAIAFRGYAGTYGQIPETITFQVSDNGSNWTTVISRSTNVPVEGSPYSAVPHSYTLNAQGRFLRLRFEDLGQVSAIILHEVEVYGKINNDNRLISFAINSPSIVGKINYTKQVVYLEVPNGTGLTNLVASFAVPVGATVRVGGVVQQSGVSSNNFNQPITYSVTAENGVVRSYAVEVIVLPADPLTTAERLDLWYRDAKVGAFLTWGLYTGGTIGGTQADALNYTSAAEFQAAAGAAGWSAQSMLASAADAGARYVVIATFHSGPAGYVKPWPSSVEGTQSTSRDFLAEILVEADALGLKVLPYITCDPLLWNWAGYTWIDEQHRSEAGWVDYAFDVTDELIDLYGDSLDGFWFDGCADNYGNGRDDAWNAKGTLAHIRARRPEYVIVVNPGDEASIINGYDVMYGEFPNTPPSPFYNKPSGYTGRPITSELSAEISVYVSPDYVAWEGFNYTPDTLANTIKRMVATSAFKPFWNAMLVMAPTIGGSLESNPAAQAAGIGDFMAWASESVYNTVPDSPSGYVAGFANNGAYVATTVNESTSTHYVHVLTPPTSDTFVVVSNNGVQASAVVNLETGSPVSYSQNSSQITINFSNWADDDTVFKIVE